MSEELNIKRVYVDCQWKKPIKAYICEYSPQLSSCLWCGSRSNEEIIERIHKFKWYKKSSNITII